MVKAAFLAVLFSTSIACMGYTIPIAGKGYDGPTNPQPGQTLAEGIVWIGTFGAVGTKAPPVMWHFDTNCSDATGNYGPNWGTQGAFKNPHSSACLDGNYESSGWVATTEFDAPDRADIEWHGSISADQNYAHELAHAWRQYFFDDDGDPDHKSEAFNGPDGTGYNDKTGMAPDDSLVGRATIALQAAGL